MNKKSPREAPQGQVIVIVALAMVLMVAMVGLVVDGGYAWGRQRQTQNASDAASEAGAVVLAQNIANVQPAKTDADVDAAVAAVFTANKTAREAAYYTDVSGNMLSGVGGTTTDPAAAVLVGGGTIPAGAAGVRAIGSQTFDTFLARVIGVNTFTAITPATAVAGYLTQVCSAEAGCDVIPITFPVTLVTCSNTGQDPEFVQPPDFWQITNEPVVIPLCGNGAGNVGWIDWYPDQTYCGNGAAEIVCEINNPNNPAIDLPSWQYVAQTGNISSSQVENALNTKYAGKIVQIPQFDITCNTKPSGPLVTDCPTSNVGGQGQNQWYHFPQFAGFQFCGPNVQACTDKGFTKGAYVNGNNPICGSVQYGIPNKTGECLVGRFVRFISKGTVGPGTGSSSGTDAIGVQLIH